MPLSTAVCSRGRGRGLATTRFLDPNTSRQITCLRNYWRRPIEWLAQQSALCRAAFTDQYWKNQSHKGSLGTVVILSEMPSVVCTSINDDSLKYFLRVGWLRVVLLVPVRSLLYTVGSLNSWMQLPYKNHLNTELNYTFWHFTLWKMSYVTCQEDSSSNLAISTSLISSALIIDYLSHLLWSLAFLITGC